MELPADPQLRWLVKRTSLLLSLGAEPVSGLVTPTAEHFPDPFDGSAESVARLLARTQELAGLGDLDISLAMVGAPDAAGSCGTGGCCGGGGGSADAHSRRVVRNDDGSYVVTIDPTQVRGAVALTTILVRAVALIFLTEIDGYEHVSPPEAERFTDLAATMLGFGALMANGSYMYAKGCGGVSVNTATALPVDQLAVALAMFCELFDVPVRSAARHLDVTPRASFSEASAWASSNRAVLRMVRANREAIERDVFTLAPARSWLARVFGLGRGGAVGASDADLDKLARDLSDRAPDKPQDPERARRLAELRDLVDESLSS